MIGEPAVHRQLDRVKVTLRRREGERRDDLSRRKALGGQSFAGVTVDVSLAAERIERADILNRVAEVIVGPPSRYNELRIQLVLRSDAGQRRAQRFDIRIQRVA